MDTLYISDLDGTLVNNDAELSQHSYKMLEELLGEGLPLTVASARSIVSIQQMLRGLRLPLPVICFNGAFLSDLHSGRHEMVHSIEADVAGAIFECLPRFDCIPYLSTYTGVEERVYYHQVVNAGMEWYLQERITRRDPRFRHTDNLSLGLREQVVCMTIINRKEVLDELEAHILDNHAGQVEVHHYENQYSPGWFWLTVHDRRASKDQAITALKQHCGLQQSRVVVFGDNKNDMSMFRAADHAVAVANATPELKSLASEVIGPNTEDSVAHYLKRNFRPKPGLL